MAYTPITLNGSAPQILMAIFTGCIGLVSLAATWEGFLLARTHLIERIILAVVTVLSLKPGTLTDIVGISLFAGVLLAQWYRNRRAVAETDNVLSTT